MSQFHVQSLKASLHMILSPFQWVRYYFFLYFLFNYFSTAKKRHSNDVLISNILCLISKRNILDYDCGKNYKLDRINSFFNSFSCKRSVKKMF